MHNRRGRPTLRVIKEDLASDWDNPFPRREIAAGHYESLHPLSELPHPIIAKAAETFGADPSNDNPVGLIASSTKIQLLEIKQGQWRGGVWKDPQTGVSWLIVAGLAKGNHQDHDDFYQIIAREDAAGEPEEWLPTPADIQLLKRETAAALMTDWELHIQEVTKDAMSELRTNGEVKFGIDHPVPSQGKIADVSINVAPLTESSYPTDEVFVEITPMHGFDGSNLIWQLTLRVLISISPPEQDWDRYKSTFSTFAEPGHIENRIGELDELTLNGALAVSKPGTESHYAHRKHLAQNTVDGTAVRALCGIFFVPAQDHHTKPVCPACEQRRAELPN